MVTENETIKTDAQEVPYPNGTDVEYDDGCGVIQGRVVGVYGYRRVIYRQDGFYGFVTTAELEQRSCDDPRSTFEYRILCDVKDYLLKRYASHETPRRFHEFNVESSADVEGGHDVSYSTTAELR